jgi:predicted nucleic acid-binding protein
LRTELLGSTRQERRTQCLVPAPSSTRVRCSPYRHRRFERAADLGPDLLGSLDAVHLAAALELGDDRLVSYDERMTRAAGLTG